MLTGCLYLAIRGAGVCLRFAGGGGVVVVGHMLVVVAASAQAICLRKQSGAQSVIVLCAQRQAVRLLA